MEPQCVYDGDWAQQNGEREAGLVPQFYPKGNHGSPIDAGKPGYQPEKLAIDAALARHTGSAIPKPDEPIYERQQQQFTKIEIFHVAG